VTGGLRVAGVVLAAGRGTRFGGVKVLALLEGRPLLAHVVEVARAVPLDDVVVVLGDAAGEVERAVAWRGERRVRNPRPADGLSGSLRLGLAALDAAVEAAVILLGDQPLVRAEVVRELVARAALTDRPIVVPRYADGGGPNPVLLRRPAWPLADATSSDRGLGPTIAAHPELVEEVAVAGGNPDVDTPADLAALAGGAAPAGTAEAEGWAGSVGPAEAEGWAGSVGPAEAEGWAGSVGPADPAATPRPRHTGRP
jgi:CTP:molybdopterin cytidylyltransferase MocA